MAAEVLRLLCPYRRRSDTLIMSVTSGKKPRGWLEARMTDNVHLLFLARQTKPESGQSDC